MRLLLSVKAYIILSSLVTGTLKTEKKLSKNNIIVDRNILVKLSVEYRNYQYENDERIAMKKILYKNKDFTVKESSVPGAGYGLFANREFQKDEELGIYEGKLLDNEQAAKIEDQAHMLDITGFKPNITTIYPSKKMMLGYINHCPATIDGAKLKGKKSPSVKFAHIKEPPYIKIVATRKIEAGEEIYLNYGRYFTTLFLKDNPKQKQFYLK